MLKNETRETPLVIEVGLDGRVQSVSAEARALLGSPDHSRIGRDCFEAFPNQPGLAKRLLLASQKRKGGSGELELASAAGQTVRIRYLIEVVRNHRRPEKIIAALQLIPVDAPAPFDPFLLGVTVLSIFPVMAMFVVYPDVWILRGSYAWIIALTLFYQSSRWLRRRFHVSRGAMITTHWMLLVLSAAFLHYQLGAVWTPAALVWLAIPLTAAAQYHARATRTESRPHGIVSGVKPTKPAAREKSSKKITPVV